MNYFFILGKNAELSLAELAQVLGDRGTITGRSGSVAFVSIPERIDAAALQSRLGGTIKCGEVIGEIRDTREIPDLVVRIVAAGESPVGKFHFGFSVYAHTGRPTFSESTLHKAGIEIKRRLKDSGVSSRLVSSKEPALSSVIVKKEKLLQGFDVCLFEMEGGRWMVGRTSAVQDFEAYGERDYGRPGSDSLSGMLPPKLAKIMINLAQVPTGGTILDPFCGSGTVLQEALALGYTHVTGSDLEAKAVADTKKNIAWLAERFGIDVTGVNVLQGEAEQIGTTMRGTQFDAIVTEPYLGPALRGRESVQELLKTKRGLETLYRDAFGQFAQVLKSGGRVVMVLPVFVSGGEMMSMDIIDDVKKMGFGVINPLSTHPSLITSHSISPFRWPLMYFREGQKVYREIWIFEKK